MAGDDQPSWTIGEIAEKLGRSVHTLRFYEGQGLLPDIRRASSGRRVYGRGDLDRITMCLNLRATGMPIPVIRRYVELSRAGDDGPALAELLTAHRGVVQEQLDRLRACLELIDHKIDVYQRPGGTCDGTAG